MQKNTVHFNNILLVIVYLFNVYPNEYIKILSYNFNNNNVIYIYKFAKNSSTRILDIPRILSNEHHKKKQTLRSSFR